MAKVPVEWSGLVLTFCNLAVEAHGGSIWVESVKSRGSTFCFTLPVALLAPDTLALPELIDVRPGYTCNRMQAEP